MNKKTRHFNKCYVKRLNECGRRIYEGNTLKHEYGLIYKVAFGLLSEDGEFEFMTKWESGDWEVAA